LKVRSYCANGDPICNFSVTALASCADSRACPHTHYMGLTFPGSTFPYTEVAAQFLAGGSHRPGSSGSQPGSGGAVPPVASGAWVTAPWVAGGFLDDVDCPGVSFCAASGQAGYPGTPVVLTSTNPTGGLPAWTPTHFPGQDNGSGAINSWMASISCPSAGLCVASDSAGGILTSTQPTTGAGAWNRITLPGVTRGATVECPSVALCVGVDSFDGLILTSTNPTGGAAAWSVEHPTGVMLASSLSCPTTAVCVAVPPGGTGSSSIGLSLNPAGGGSTWSQVTAAPARGAVSCPTASRCFTTAPNVTGLTLAARFGASTFAIDGGGLTDYSTTDLSSLVPPDVEGLDWARLGAIDCPTTSLCVAGGLGSARRESRAVCSRHPTRPRVSAPGARSRSRRDRSPSTATRPRSRSARRARSPAQRPRCAG
jgi:hypothetical protein